MRIHDEDIFISKMLEETYQTIRDGETSKSAQDLWQYFSQRGNQISQKSKIEQFCQQNIMTCYQVEYVDALACFRLHFPKPIDIPRNWSFFKQFYIGLKNGLLQLLYVSSDNDFDGLLEVLGPVLGIADLNLVLVGSSEYTAIIPIPYARKDFVVQLKNFLGIEETPILKAA